jgi:heat shock protein HslJ
MLEVLRFVAAATLLAALVTACGGFDNTRPATTTPGQAPSGSPAAPGTPAAGAPGESAATAAGRSTAAESLALDRTRWSLSDSALAAPAPDDTAGVRLEFQKDRLSASSGCNVGSGTFRFEGDVLVVGPMATTRRACPEAAAAYERAFFAFLGSRPRARVDEDGVLVLESGDAAKPASLRFRAQPMPSANAVQKFIYVASTQVPCAGVASTQCLQVRETTSEPWRAFHGEIVGFKPEPGIEYRLRVLEDPVPSPAADASSKRWYLDLVVEQRVVTP